MTSDISRLVSDFIRTSLPILVKEKEEDEEADVPLAEPLAGDLRFLGPQQLRYMANQILLARMYDLMAPKVNRLTEQCLPQSYETVVAWRHFD